VLEFLETEEFYLFLGCCLARDENVVAANHLDLKMLEDLDPSADGSGFDDAISLLERMV
jgi:hypothetical protein